MKDGMSAHERNCIILLGTTIVVQSAHMAEHVAQFIQWMMRLSLSHGIIGSLDLEVVHFIYDGLFLIGLSALGSFYGDVLRAKGRPAYAVFATAWAVQTYHMLEHVVRMAQHAETGLQGTPGILGRFVPIVPLHFAFNLVVTLGIIAPFFMLGMHRKVPALLGLRPRAEARS